MQEYENKMVLKSNVKANTVANSFMWIAGIMTAILCLMWVLSMVDPSTSLQIDLINYDMMNLQYKVSEACNSAEYRGRYNPRVEEGIFSIFDDEICIEAYNIRHCVIVICNTQARYELKLDELTFVMIIKDEHGVYSVEGN